jgi:formaldehyde-activating enzyme involved in methanogenesis
MNRYFSQTITVHCSEPAKLIEFARQRDIHRATTDITGYMGSRVLADREHEGRYVIIVDFGAIDPDVSAADEAARNNERPETKAMAAALAEILDGAPEYHQFDEVYRTDQTL